MSSNMFRVFMTLKAGMRIRSVRVVQCYSVNRRDVLTSQKPVLFLWDIGLLQPRLSGCHRSHHNELTVTSPSPTALRVWSNPGLGTLWNRFSSDTSCKSSCEQTTTDVWPAWHSQYSTNHYKHFD